MDFSRRCCHCHVGRAHAVGTASGVLLHQPITQCDAITAGHCDPLPRPGPGEIWKQLPQAQQLATVVWHMRMFTLVCMLSHLVNMVLAASAGGGLPLQRPDRRQGGQDTRRGRRLPDMGRDDQRHRSVHLPAAGRC